MIAVFELLLLLLLLNKLRDLKRFLGLRDSDFCVVVNTRVRQCMINEILFVESFW